MISSPGIVFQWETIRAYCHRIGLPGLEEVFADELAARGYKMIRGNENDMQE